MERFEVIILIVDLKIHHEEEDYDLPALGPIQFDNDEEDSTNDTRKPILISYLAAVSQFKQNLFESLIQFANSKSGETSNLTNYLEGQKCFSTHFEGSMISGAIQVAIDDVNNDPNLLPDHKLKYIFNNTCGNEMRSGKPKG